MTAWPAPGSGGAMSMEVTDLRMASVGILPLAVVGWEHGDFLLHPGPCLRMCQSFGRKCNAIIMNFFFKAFSDPSGIQEHQTSVEASTSKFSSPNSKQE